jgi:alkane 1-monooxygenase
MKIAALNTVKSSANWLSIKKYSFLLALVTPLFLVVSAFATIVSNHGLWLWLTAIVYFVIVPLVDAAIGHDITNPTKEQESALKDDQFYVWIMYLSVPIYWMGIAFTAYALATVELSWHSYIGAILSTGAMHALGITMAHELGHRINKKGQVLAAKIIVASCGYGHFNIEHNQGHHKHVATPEDPASSRMGEGFYTFALREIPGTFVRAMRLETQRLEKDGHSFWSIQNNIIHSWLITLFGFGAITAICGIAALPYLIVAGLYGCLQLTLANYIEHYGLLRQKDENGRYERCQPEHSWNSNFFVSNLFSLHLQRHSDHHANPARPYQLLRDINTAPDMPTGYPTMMMLAMFPPLWFFVMDRRVVRWADNDMTRVNMHSSAKNKLFARYHNRSTGNFTLNS